MDCLDPSNNFWGDLDPGAKFWVQGPFGPKLKNMLFSHKTAQYGWLWTRLDPSNQFFRWFEPWVQILGPRDFWHQIKKSALFLQNPTIWVSMVTWTLDPNFGAKDPLNQPFLLKLKGPEEWMLFLVTGYGHLLTVLDPWFYCNGSPGSRSEQGRPEGPILRVR